MERYRRHCLIIGNKKNNHILHVTKNNVIAQANISHKQSSLWASTFFLILFIFSKMNVLKASLVTYVSFI